MERKLRIISILALVALLGLGIRHEFKRYAQSKRETAYRSTLQTYSYNLKPGMTRKVVESFLQAKNVDVLHMCCIVFSRTVRHSWDDIIKIGEEDTPWYCGRHSVYLAFQFNGFAKLPGYETIDNDLDTLKAITIYHRMEYCL